jgi:hypothetical protein
MHHPVTEIGGEDLTPFGAFNQKGRAGAGRVRSGVQFVRQREQVGFQIQFELQRLRRVALPCPALPVGVIKSFLIKQRVCHAWSGILGVQTRPERSDVERLQRTPPRNSQQLNSLREVAVALLKKPTAAISSSSPHRPRIVRVRLVVVVHVAVVQVHVPRVGRIRRKNPPTFPALSDLKGVQNLSSRVVGTTGCRSRRYGQPVSSCLPSGRRDRRTMKWHACSVRRMAERQFWLNAAVVFIERRRL